MKHIYIIGLLLISVVIYSCSKEEYFKSESGIKKQLQGTWKLIPIPKYDNINGVDVVHEETWTFSESQVSILMSNAQQSASSTYSVNTSITKAEVKLDDVKPLFNPPARVCDNNGSGTWQIISLDDEFLSIANDQSGATGLTILEFQKK